MRLLKFLGVAFDVANAVVTDDNGHPYKDDDGGYIPNNEYDLDGVHYETDDNGSIYRADGEYYPDDYFELEGVGFSTDENGNLQNE